ncbi:hypothetical protein SASPL_121306 [Salvia splendens]|uniref:Major facilitator superfamily (MFS) profile domain-containing protein n=1 Tax=Salvia splendens TaxID=180675 RepID=A0A8X8ZVZ3_SALSN|nr:hypothetical protein SASPL_121306 [Salvia splendens]
MNSDVSQDEDVCVSYPFEENGIISSSNYVMACSIFASLNSVLLGYDVGVMSGANWFIQEDLKISEVQEEVFVGILSIKWTMAFAAMVFQFGAGIMALASSFTVLMMGRLLAGIGMGFGIMITPVYIAEIAPTVSRGSLTSFPEIFINLGILLGYISNYSFSGLPAHINWRIMLAVGTLPSIFIGGALFVIPESLRWLVMQNRIDEARSVLFRINENAGEVEGKLAEIQEAARFMIKDRSEDKAVWREMLNPTPGVRRMLITGCGIQMFQQMTGIDATVYYSPTIFNHAGIQGNTQLLAATVAVGFTKTIFILIAILLIDKAACLGFHWLFCVCGNVAFFSVGIGPICWVVSSEIFPLKLRAQASAIGSVGSRVSSSIIAMSFLSVNRTFLVFAAISALSVVFVYKYVPETKGKSLEQIELLFQNDSYWEDGEVELQDVQHLIQRE